MTKEQIHHLIAMTAAGESFRELVERYGYETRVADGRADTQAFVDHLLNLTRDEWRHVWERVREDEQDRADRADS